MARLNHMIWTRPRPSINIWKGDEGTLHGKCFKTAANMQFRKAFRCKPDMSFRNQRNWGSGWLWRKHKFNSLKSEPSVNKSVDFCVVICSRIWNWCVQLEVRVRLLFTSPCRHPVLFSGVWKQFSTWMYADRRHPTTLYSSGVRLRT